MPDNAPRPTSLAGFLGQDHIRPNLEVFLQSARQRKAALDHILLFGPPGLGKTTLAQIIANELGSKCYSAMAPGVKTWNDLVRLFGPLQEGDVVFLDEIHALGAAISETIYPVMEDFTIEMSFGEGRDKRKVQASMPRFTLIGATTRAGQLSQPLRDRFGIHLKLNLYEAEQLAQVLMAASRDMGIPISPAACRSIACRARGTPRIALQLLRRCFDFATVDGGAKIEAEMADGYLYRLGIDSEGLNAEDHRYLRTLAETFGGGPVGVDPIAAAMGDDPSNVMDVIEPFLIQAGFVLRTGRGRLMAPHILPRYMPGLQAAAQ